MAKKPLKLAPKKSGGKKGGESDLKVEKELASQDAKPTPSKSNEDLELFEGGSHFEIRDDAGLDIDKTVVTLDLETKSRVISIEESIENLAVKPSSEDENFLLDDVDPNDKIKTKLDEDDDFTLDTNDKLEGQDEPEVNFSLDDPDEGPKSSAIDKGESFQDNDLDRVDEDIQAEPSFNEEPASSALAESANSAPDVPSEPEINSFQAEVQGTDVRPSTEGKRLCACSHCGVEYYLLKELIHREALCVKCQKVFVIEFSPEEELLVVNEEDLEELGARDFDAPDEESDKASIEEGGTISIDYGNSSTPQNKQE